MFTDDSHVKIEKAIVTWDGITRPEEKPDGSVSHNIGFAIADNAPEKPELDQLVQKALDNSDFRGVLPAGANPALKPADVQKFGQLLNGHSTGNAATLNGAPPIFDENGTQLNVADLQGVLYAGCEVSLLVHAYAYNNKQRGVKFGIDGIQIKNRNAPKLDVAAGLSQSQVANVFGAQTVMAQPQAQAPAPQAQAPAPAPAPAPATDLAAGKIMTDAAQGVPYQSYIDAGWTDEQLIANGLMIQQ